MNPILKNFGISTLVLLGVFAGVTLLPNALVVNGLLKEISSDIGGWGSRKQETLENHQKQMSVVVLNTGNTYRCGEAGRAKTRPYFEQLLSQGWRVASSETNNFNGGYGVGRGPCSLTYYILEK